MFYLIFYLNLIRFSIYYCLPFYDCCFAFVWLIIKFSLGKVSDKFELSWRKKLTCVLFIGTHSLRGLSHLEVPKTFLLPFDKVLTCQKIPDLDSQSVMFYKQIHPLNPFRHDPTQKHINSHFLYAQLELWHSCWDYVISKLVLAGPQKTGCALQ